jgi:hypothetical protein
MARAKQERASLPGSTGVTASDYSVENTVLILTYLILYGDVLRPSLVTSDIHFQRDHRPRLSASRGRDSS